MSAYFFFRKGGNCSSDLQLKKKNWRYLYLVYFVVFLFIWCFLGGLSVAKSFPSFGTPFLLAYETHYTTSPQKHSTDIRWIQRFFTYSCALLSSFKSRSHFVFVFSTYYIIRKPSLSSNRKTYFIHSGCDREGMPLTTNGTLSIYIWAVSFSCGPRKENEIMIRCEKTRPISRSGPNIYRLGTFWYQLPRDEHVARVKFTSEYSSSQSEARLRFCCTSHFQR